jgi:hypothetical protein
MNPALSTLPADFIPITLVLPGTDQPEMLGYTGDERFVGFYWDTETGRAVWTDGTAALPGRSQNFTFLRFVRPLSFLHNVNFGTRGGHATHVLIWDRENSIAYMTPRESAMRFLRQQQFSFPVEAMSVPAIPLQQRTLS